MGNMPRFKYIILLLVACFIAGCSSPEIDVKKADKLVLLSAKYNEAAIRIYDKAIKHCSKKKFKDDICFKLARLYFNSGNYPEAIQQLRTLATDKATSKLLGIAFFKNSDWTEALEVFNKTEDKNDPEYLYFYGLTLEKNNLYDKALDIYSFIQNDGFFGKKSKERINAINLNSEKIAFLGVDEEIKKIIQQSPGQEKYPEAAGLYLFTDDNISLTEDNRLISDSHYVIKILNDRGKEKYGEIVLGYDSTYEKVELEYARMIKPDGTVVTVGDKNIRDVSVYLNYPLYSNARAKIISMPEVCDGAVIEYKVRLYQNKLPNKKDFCTVYWLQSGDPILFQKCSIDIPKNRGLKYKIVNAEYNTFDFDMNPKVSEVGNKRIFSFEFKDVPQIIPEPGMPPVSKINPYILFSTFENWQDIYVWWQGLYKDKIIADEDIKLKTAELIKDKKSVEDKIRAIYNFCVNDVRYVAVEYGDAGYEPHKAGDIFKNKYGDCKDKAILLVSMLSSAGIEAYPVLISTYGSFEVQENFPSLLFDHAIAAVKLGEGIIFMDVTGSTVSFQDLPLMDQSRLTVVFFKDKPGLIKTPLFNPEHNKVSAQMTIKTNRDESVDVERKVSAKGAYQQAQRGWLKFTQPSVIEDELKQKARIVADNAVLKDYEIKNADDLDKPILLKYKFSAPQYFTKAAKSRIMPKFSEIDTSAISKDLRHYPIELGALDLQEEVIDIELPAHLSVKYLPPPVEMDTKWFYFSRKSEKVGKNMFRLYSVNKTKEKTVLVQDYSEYKKSIESIVSLINQHVVLEEK